MNINKENGFLSLSDRFLSLHTHIRMIEEIVALKPSFITDIHVGDALISSALSWIGYSVGLIDSEINLERAKTYGKFLLKVGDVFHVDTMMDSEVYISFQQLNLYYDEQIPIAIDNMLKKSSKAVLFVVKNDRDWKKLLHKYNVSLTYYNDKKNKTIKEHIINLFHDDYVLGVIKK